MQNLIYYTQDFCTQYIDDYDKLPYDINGFKHHVERLLVASAPWQSWAMDVRAVYRWEDPKKTGKWLVLFIVLWYTEHVGGFVVSKTNICLLSSTKSLASGAM